MSETQEPANPHESPEELTQPENLAEAAADVESEAGSEQGRERLISDLEQQVSDFDGPRSDREVQQRAAEIHEQYAAGLPMADELGEGTGEALEQKMNEEVSSLESINAKYREAELEMRQQRAEQFLDTLQENGVGFDDATREQVAGVLLSPEIVHIDRQELVEMLQIDRSDTELLSRLADRTVLDQFGKLIRDQLTESNQELFAGSELRLAGGETAEIDGEQVDLAELSDPEYADMGPEQIRLLVDEIISDRTGSAGQGTFWNAQVPSQLPFVLKTARRPDDPGMARTQRDDLLHYPAVRKGLGSRFLPKQAVFRTDSSEQLSILQEKMPLNEMVSVRNYNVDQLLSGEYAPEITEALQDDENNQTLREFLDGAERLYKEDRLVVDSVGDNIFFKVDQDGKLDIKLVDYGCAKQRREEPNDHTKKVFDYLGKLRSLVR